MKFARQCPVHARVKGEQAILTTLLASTMVVSAFLACSTGPRDDAGGTRAAPLDVPPSWQQARTGGGHTTHVTERQIACNQCHADGAAFNDPGPAPCGKCHAAQSRIEHAVDSARAEFGPDAHSDCTSCHAFATPEVDAGLSSAAWNCKRCHEPHGVAGAAFAKPSAHADAPCQACHTPHGETIARAAECRSCHTTLRSNHGRDEQVLAAGAALAAPGAGAPEQPCQACHREPHAPRAQALEECATCHAQQQPTVGAHALFSPGHERCTSCHQPHDFQRAAVADCRSCHQQERALAAERVPAHAECTSCHRPHDVRNDPAAACADCHRALANDHPATPGHSSCTTCHAPHPARAPGAVTASVSQCSSCHHRAPNDHAFHAEELACSACHVPHGFKLAAQGTRLCARCHAPEASGVAALGAGHASCSGCHRGLPHDTGPDPVACATCHAAESAAAHTGHARCQGCHDPHSGAQERSCASCHREESASAPRGHAECRACHEPHGGRLQVTGCTTCHAQQASAPHHDLERGCQTCHSAHGPSAISPPACTSCHEPARGPGLHSVPQHASCRDCHSAHVKQARPEVEACRSCHREREQHFPEANRCTGCHLFTSL